MDEFINFLINEIMKISSYHAQKMFANYVCCIYSNAIQTNFIMETNTMNPDRTAPKGAIRSGFILFAI